MLIIAPISSSRGAEAWHGQCVWTKRRITAETKQGKPSDEHPSDYYPADGLIVCLGSKQPTCMSWNQNKTLITDFHCKNLQRSHTLLNPRSSYIVDTYHNSSTIPVLSNPPSPGLFSQPRVSMLPKATSPEPTSTFWSMTLSICVHKPTRVHFSLVATQRLLP